MMLLPLFTVGALVLQLSLLTRSRFTEGALEVLFALPLHEDISLSRVQDLRRMVHEVVMKDFNVVIPSGFLFLLLHKQLFFTSLRFHSNLELRYFIVHAFQLIFTTQD